MMFVAKTDDIRYLLQESIHRMNIITAIVLENEMDLILAYKQSMKLAELLGFTLPAQTTFATSVSEVSRSAIQGQRRPALTLCVSDKKEKVKFLTATLEDNRKFFVAEKDEGYINAKRLMPNISTTTTPTGNRMEFHLRLPANLRIDDAIIEKWRTHLNIDLDVSPYEEIKRKNRQLIAMADKLRESEHQYKSLTDSLPIMIFSMDAEGSLTYANSWVSDYTGQSRDEINESKWRNIVHPDDFSGIWEDWQTRSADLITVIPDRRLRQKTTDEYRWHTGVTITILDEDGAVKGTNTFLVDVHAQRVIEQTLTDNVLLKRIQGELEQKIVQLDYSNNQLKQFAYIAAHDLQEPLRKIVFYSDILNRKYGTTLTDEARMFFNNLITSADRMRVLINDVLAYSMVQKDNFIEVELNHIVQEMLSDLEVSILEKGATIHVTDLPPVNGNETQLKQLFENLVSNALKFSKPDVPPVISLSAEIVDNAVNISFADNGIGFDEEYVEKMFDIFQRLHTREKFTGTGIGLAICKKIVDMHHGKITAKGTPNTGANFIVTLPLRQTVSQ